MKSKLRKAILLLAAGLLLAGVVLLVSRRDEPRVGRISLALNSEVGIAEG